MPNVTVVPRDVGGGELSTYWVDSIGTTSTTFTFPKQQQSITVRNKGNQDITVTINATPHVINKNTSYTQELTFTALSIVASTGIQQYELSAKVYTSVRTDIIPNGTTAERPTGIKVGYDYYDTTLNKPVWHNGGGVWKDAAGTTV